MLCTAQGSPLTRCRGFLMVRQAEQNQRALTGVFVSSQIKSQAAP